jgi:thiosulfate sulfurtransferase
MATAISTDDLSKSLKSVRPMQIVDVRSKLVFDAATHLLPGTVWRNPEEVLTWQATLDRNFPVVVYCVHRHQISQGCADALTTAEFDARYLEGGIEQWTTDGKSIRPMSTRSEL